MSSEIKNKIAKLDAAIKSPATPANMLGKLKETKASFEKELAALESANKQVPKVQPKTSKAKQQKVAKQKVVSKAKAKVSKVAAEAKTLLAKLRMSKEQKAFNEGRTKKELDKDAKREALPIGKRISAEGNTYYEYRSNKADVSTKKKPYLEMGGELASKSHFKYYKVPNEQLWAIQECNKEFKDEFGGECIVIKNKKSKQDAIKEVERLNRLGYSDYEKGGEVDYFENLAVYVQGKGQIYQGESMKKALKVANDYLKKEPNAEITIIDEKYGDEYDLNGLQYSDYEKGGELSKTEKDRLDYLQSKEDTDSLTKSENEEYEMLVEKYRETKEYAAGGKVSNKGAYQNKPESGKSYTRYEDSKDSNRAKPAGWRYTDAGAKRLKLKNSNVLVSKDHLQKYRGKYFTDSKGVKHRYVYIERREDKSDIKRGFPYLERGGKIDASFVRLETTDGNKITEQTSIPKADEALYYFWKIDKYSDVVYKITFEDGETLEGIIDLEPKEFHEGHKFNILTWHINTFWNNVARSNRSYISQSNKDEAKRLVDNYNLYEKGGKIGDIIESPSGNYNVKILETWDGFEGWGEDRPVTYAKVQRVNKNGELIKTDKPRKIIIDFKYAKGGIFRNLDKIKSNIGVEVYNTISKSNKEQLENSLKNVKEELQRVGSNKDNRYYKLKDEEFLILYRLERSSEFEYAIGGNI
jgi:hypothetical protein